MSVGRIGAITCPLLGLLAAPAAFAESASQTAPLVSDGLKEYEPTGIDLGGVRVLPTVQYILYGDDNVYAAPTAKQGDAVFNVLAGLDARHRVRDLEFRGLATTNIRRYFDLSSENSESATVEGAINWQPRQAENLNFTGGWYRTVEDRGDPRSTQPAIDRAAADQYVRRTGSIPPGRREVCRDHRSRGAEIRRTGSAE